MPDNKGYYPKYDVTKNSTGEVVTDRTFTLNLDTDPAAWPALRAYRDFIANAGGFDALVADLDAMIEEEGA